MLCCSNDNSAETPEKPATPAKEKPPFTISHETKRRHYWNLFMFIICAVIGATVPLRCGFLIREWKGWIGPDIFIWLVLVSDIIINLLTTYEEDGEIVKDRALIRGRYLRGWLIPDILAVLPLELISAGLGEYNPLFIANRLIKIGHLVVFFVEWERMSSLKPSVIRIFKSAFIILFLAHLIGCIFFLVILIEGDDAKQDFTGTAGIRDLSVASQYMRSFYWSFVTMTGYNNTNPDTPLETSFCIIVTVIGISLFATIIGTVGSLVTNLDSSKLYFRQKMDGINDYMKYKRIPDELQMEVRNYYNYLWKSGKGLDKNKVLDDLPPYLKNKMSVYLNKEIITKVPMFSNFKDDEAFISEIIKALKSRVSLPNSFVVKKGEIGTEMYFISRGELNVVNDAGMVVFTLKDGGFFGEIALIYETKRTASIVARTYCDMFILTKDDFNNVKDKFPVQVEAIEKEAAERRRANAATAAASEKQKKDEEQKASTSDASVPEKHHEASTNLADNDGEDSKRTSGSQGPSTSDKDTK
jgi:CRP-like cAMP-binding protein